MGVHLIVVGDEIINPRYLIRAHPWRGPASEQYGPGDYRVVVVGGEEFPIRGADVPEFRRMVEPFLVKEREGEGPPSVSRPVDPATVSGSGAGASARVPKKHG